MSDKIIAAYEKSAADCYAAQLTTCPMKTPCVRAGVADLCDTCRMLNNRAVECRNRAYQLKHPLPVATVDDCVSFADSVLAKAV